MPEWFRTARRRLPAAAALGLGAAALGVAAPAFLPGAAGGLTSLRMLEGLALLVATGSCLLLARRLARERTRHERHHTEAMADLYLSVIEALALAIDAKDRTTERRLRRVQTFAEELGALVGLPPDELEALRAAALLHDIGKVAVPEYILCKPGRLTREEFEKMSIHARVGAEILERVRFPYPVARVVRAHHEKYDGSGYPDRLAGGQIPLAARVLTLVDCFDALTSDRPYRRALDREQAVAQIEREAGSSFDPRLVHLLVQHLDRIEAAMERRGRADRETPAARDEAPDPAFLDPSTIRAISSAHLETSGLFDIARDMASSLDLREAVGRLSGKVERLVHHRCLIVWLLDADRRVLRARCAAGKDAPRVTRLEIPLGERMSGQAALHVRPIAYLPDAEAAPAAPGHDFEELLSARAVEPLRCAAAAPLFDGDAVLGVLAVYDVAGRPYDEGEARRLAEVARHLSDPVRNALLYEEARTNAMTDPLTSLPNARFLFGSFEQEIRRAERHGSPLSLVELDIDHFKTVNDRFGHPAGDRILRGVARAVRGQLRPGDTCVRYAGDEFIVTVPGVGADGIDAVMARIEAAILRHKFAVARGRSITITVSLGAASFPEDGRTYEALMAVADARMYRAKFSRRGGAAGALRLFHLPGRSDLPVN